MSGAGLFIRLRGRPRLLAVDECEKDNVLKHNAKELYASADSAEESKVPRALPVGLHLGLKISENKRLLQSAGKIFFGYTKIRPLKVIYAAGQ